MITETRLTFPGYSRDLAGLTVAVVARPAEVKLPPGTLVVQVNHALGFDSHPSCFELFTVLNRRLLRIPGQRFKVAASIAGTIRVRMPKQPLPLLDTIAPGSAAKAVRLVVGPSKVHEIGHLATSGVVALCFYEARGALVIPVGFSLDRAKLSANNYHLGAAEWEAAVLRRLDPGKPYRGRPDREG